MDDFFAVAKIIGNFGFNGYLILKSLTDFEDTILSLHEVFIDVFGGIRKFLVEDIKKKNGQYLIKFKNFDSYEDVLFLFKKNIFIESDYVHKLEENQYYVHDLIGSNVIRGKVFFGKVIDVISLPSNDVLVVKTNKGKEALIPFIRDYVFLVDLQNGMIKISDKEDFISNDK